MAARLSNLGSKGGEVPMAMPEAPSTPADLTIERETLNAEPFK